jgi:hypothetical protein
MFEFKHEFIPTCLNSYILKSMNSYQLTPWPIINIEHHAFGPEIRCFLPNFLDGSGEFKRLVLVLDTG